MPSPLRLLVHDVSGATAIEYALIAGLIAAVIIVSVLLVGAEVQNLFDDVAAGVASVP
jgi:pilus assembly protein Flp/PilA